MSINGKYKFTLDPEAPGLDALTRRRRRALAALEQMSVEELFQLAVRAGIYTPDGELTAPYRDDAEPSASRPTDRDRGHLRANTSIMSTSVMSTNGKCRFTLDPEAPGLDEETRRRRRALAKMQQASPEELFQVAARAGIYTPDGELTPPYRDDAEPSASRPTD